MEIFLSIFFNLLPLYVLIGIGWFAGRYFEIQRQTLANLALFVLMPVMIFGFTAQLDLQPAYILLPFVMLAIQSCVAFAFLYVGRLVYQDNTPNLLAMCTAMGNFGYMGLPIVLLLFPVEMIGIYMFFLLGNILFEASVGYYIGARGNFTVQQSFKKLMHFPAIYAVFLGLIVNWAQWSLPTVFFTYLEYFKGAYILSGMMIIGVALARVEKIVLGPRFLALVFVGKFIAWPFCAFLVVGFDSLVTNLFTQDIHRILLILSLVPPGANIAAFATQLNLTPEKAATTVLLGTIFALFYIPFVFYLMNGF